MKGRPDEIEDFAQLYVPLRQNAWPNSYVVIRAMDGDATALVPAVRAAIAEVAPGQAVNNAMTLEDVAGTATEQYWFRAVLVGMFGSLALVLAMVGVFGVLAYAVQQRTRELGVRIALGATPGRVLLLVLSSAGRVVTLGAVVGLLAAAGLGQAISSFLFGYSHLICPLSSQSVECCWSPLPSRWQCRRSAPHASIRSWLSEMSSNRTLLICD